VRNPATAPVSRTAILALCLAGAASAQAAEVLVNADITVSTTWTANNTYNLQKQIYVKPGATLTIEAGTIIASTTNLGGSLAVTRGGKIVVNGTQDKPVIMTSKADVATWTGGNPKTGTWREAANEWGNLTLMGNAYVSSCETGNSKTFSANNQNTMEGLTAAFPGDPNVKYGGGNDDDDSGSINFLSIRYGGKVIALNNELNGLSLGGLGRETDINHVEIMNNVDDGIEIWGGTVNLKYVSIWNVGDDSFDVDQGWRGKAQFGLIVQGYSLDASQGSGVGDNGFETDGAEFSDHQPVTTANLYNMTFIGQPFDGDGATAWRDNARVQYHNCIFMDCGEKVVRFDNVDGDPCGTGYGFNGTLDWPTTWTTAYTQTSTVNPARAPLNPANLYTAQQSGKLIEMTNSVFYNNIASGAYTEADARGVFGAANNNVKEPSGSPIVSITRGAPVVKGGKAIVPVTQLDPRAANDAVTSSSAAPVDGFFNSVSYRGAFSPENSWLCGWTASEAFGMTPPSNAWCDLGKGCAGEGGKQPLLSGTGNLTGGSQFSIKTSHAKPNAMAAIMLGASRADIPLFGCTLVPLPAPIDFSFPLNASGEFSLVSTWPNGVVPGTELFWQTWVVDPTGAFGMSSSNALSSKSP